MDGAKGYTFLFLTIPAFIKLSNIPGAFQHACLFKLLVLETMIPVACVGVHYQFGPCPQIFSRALAQFCGWAAWRNWQGLLSAELKLQHPRALRLCPSLPAPYERGECPSRLLPRICPRGISVLRVPFPMGHPCPVHYPDPLDPWPTLAD